MDWYLITFYLPWVILPIAMIALVLAVKARRQLRYHDEVISRIVQKQAASRCDDGRNDENE